ILEEVCMKQKFFPVDEFVLLHGRSPVDLSLAFRFSNLPNNAKLELVRAPHSRSQTQEEVTIALQLESGERMQHTFCPTTSLWDIIQHWKPPGDRAQREQPVSVGNSDVPSLHPVCIYMREEVVGETALKHVTLKRLALTSGKAVIRLVHRPVDSSTIAEINNRIEQEKARQAKFAVNEQFQQLSAQASCSSHGEQLSPGECSVEDSKPTGSNTPSQDVSMLDDHRQGPEHEQDTEGQNEECMGTSHEDDHSVPFHTKESSDQEKTNSSAQRGAELSAVERLQMMNIPGVEIFTPDDFSSLSPQQQQNHDTQEPKVRSICLTKCKSDVKPEEFKPCDREELVYDSNEQGSSGAVKEVVRHQHYQNNRETATNTARNTIGVHGRPVSDRTVRLCLAAAHPENHVPARRPALTVQHHRHHVGEDFFELTETDIRSLMKDLQRQASSERPLMTEAMRMAKMEEQHQYYDFVVLRVQFPDGLVLQGCFRPRETVFALYRFVREHLENKEQEFYLYISPPRQILSDTAKTLVQAQLAPASVVYFGSNHSADHGLAGSAIMNIVSKRKADEVSAKRLAKKQMETLTSSDTESHIALGASSGATAATVSDRAPSVRSRTASAPSHDSKLPKWLKL
ncbi:hypothetical protein BaRGS_00002462, partial [Batillaria attramentaria]